MRSVSVRELQTRTSELVREAANGKVIVIERQGQPIAELRPISTTKVRLPDLRDVWSRFPPVPGDSGRFLEEDRQAVY